MFVVIEGSLPVSLAINFCDLCSTTRTLQFFAFHEPELSFMWSWPLSVIFLLLKFHLSISVLYFYVSLFLYYVFCCPDVDETVWRSCDGYPVYDVLSIILCLFDYIYMRSHIVYFCVFDIFEVSFNKVYFRSSPSLIL